MSTRRCITHHHACDCREARFAEMERENARLTAELEDACRTCAELVTDGNAVTLAQSLQRAAAENARLREDKARLDWLERFLQMGGASVFTTCTGRAVERRDDDTDETQWNHPFCIGHDVEVEHRGCYRWEEYSNGSKGIRPAIDAARAKQAALNPPTDSGTKL
jgi:hypothetical protein